MRHSGFSWVYVENGEGNVIEKEEIKVKLSSIMTGKDSYVILKTNDSKDCYSCNKIFTCLNKMCPLKKVTDKTYKCNEYQSFFTQTTLNDF